MNQVLDPGSDANREELSRLSRLYAFPEFVKRADLDTTMATQVGVSTHADPRHRRFSCHSAAATWLSGLYFHEKCAEFHPKDRQRIQERLEHYVNYFRIKPAYDRMVQAVEGMHKQADLPDETYAYVWVDDQNGSKERHLPMQSAIEVKAAAEWLHRYRGRLPFHDRNTCACRILEKAAQFGAAIPAKINEWLEKQAGQGVCDPQKVYQAIAQRAQLTKSAEFRNEILKLAKTVQGKPSYAFEPGQMVKLAVTLDHLDRALGIRDDSYGAVLQRPEDILFEVTFTKAAAAQTELCALTSGNVYSKEQLAKLSSDDLASLFGADFADEVCSLGRVDVEKLAEVAHTLPRPDAELLDQLMQEVGASPTLQKSASTRHGLSQKELEALATQYH